MKSNKWLIRWDSNPRIRVMSPMPNPLGYLSKEKELFISTYIITPIMIYFLTCVAVNVPYFPKLNSVLLASTPTLNPDAHIIFIKFSAEINSSL